MGLVLVPKNGEERPRLMAMAIFFRKMVMNHHISGGFSLFSEKPKRYFIPNSWYIILYLRILLCGVFLTKNRWDINTELILPNHSTY